MSKNVLSVERALVVVIKHDPQVIEKWDYELLLMLLCTRRQASKMFDLGWGYLRSAGERMNSGTIGRFSKS